MKNWKKGAIHCHTMWSDGRSLPEIALKAYRDRGYDFVCLSDHNAFQDDPDVWIQLRHEEGRWPPMLSFDEYKRTVEELPGSVVEKRISYKHYIRLKTFEELKAEFEKDGNFILVPGTEMTSPWKEFDRPGAKAWIHCNTFNLPETLPMPTCADPVQYLKELLEIYNSKATENSLFMVNHPWSRAWDIDPEMLINFPEIRLMEICNCGAEDIPEGWIYDREKYWDFITAHRVANGDLPVYGTASDDAHFYDPERINVAGGCGSGFVVVNCPGEFTPDNLAAALRAGDFYSSCGVMLDDVCFTDGILKVKVHAEAGVKYRIDFISTKAGFDRSMRKKEFPFKDETFSRVNTVIPDGIGEIVYSVDGTSAEYRMADDDLYIRAIVTSDQDPQIKINFYPQKQTAWTQPFVRKA